MRLFSSYYSMLKAGMLLVITCLYQPTVNRSFCTPNNLKPLQFLLNRTVQRDFHICAFFMAWELTYFIAQFQIHMHRNWKTPCILKGLSHEILRFFWLVWSYLGGIGTSSGFSVLNRFLWFLDSQVKYWCVSYQTFPKIRGTSEKDWQLSLRFSNFPNFLG